MRKQLMFFLLIVSVNVLKAEPGGNKNHLYNHDLFYWEQYFQCKSDSIITEHYNQVNNFSLFNDNVNFSNRNHTYNSLLKMGGEALSGGVLGFAFGTFMYNTFQPKVKRDGTGIGKLIQIAFTIGGAGLGITYGVYYLGKLLGDEGEIKNLRFWMILTGAVTYGFSRVFTSNENTRIWISIASLPLGAAFGFNTNDISDWIFPANK